MSEAYERVSAYPSTLDYIWGWLLRGMAVYSLIFGILYWIRLIGVFDGVEWRFDLMPVHWQVCAVVLAVFFPFAASGLWMMASWGPVIWFICAAIELTMFVGFPGLFGKNLPVVVSHLLVAVAFVALRVMFFMRQRQEVD